MATTDELENQESIFDNVLLSKSIKKTPNFSIIENKYRIEAPNHYYNHLTFKATSLLDYLDIINFLKKYRICNKATLIYRGQSNHEWFLCPSIGRKQFYSLDPAESEMIFEMIGERPSAFDSCNSNFEILTMMQHFGLPTRLLDFTFNPLIALFFTCISENDSDGRVVCSSPSMSHTKDMIYAEAICSLYRDSYYLNESIDDWLSKHNISVEQYIRRVYTLIDDSSIVIKPKYWNERLLRQSSVFMVFPNNISDKILEVNELENYKFDTSVEMLEDIELRRKETHDFYHKTCVGKSSARKFIAKARELNQSCEELNDYLRDRFMLRDELMLIDEDTIKDFHISIYIPSDSKQEILSELENINIDSSFVFPELEYLAKKVSTKYW